MIDADTVIGTPIVTASGTTIIPISKVTIGFASGGVDFNDKSGGSKDKPQNFGAGGGSGIALQPVSMLCINKDGRVELINIGVKNPPDPVDQIAYLLERSPEIIAKIKAVFDTVKPEETTAPAIEAAETVADDAAGEEAPIEKT